MRNETLAKIDYKNLINMAITEKGTLSKCYELFHDYSLLNSLYIIRQLNRKGLSVQPIKGYKAWEQLNRKVKNDFLTNKTRYGFINEHSIEVLYPVFGYYPLKDENGQNKIDEKGKQVFRKYVKNFNYSSWHFAYEQTEAIDNTKPIDTLTENHLNIDIEKLTEKLNINIIEYNDIDGNKQGYSYPCDRTIAINPVAKSPVKTGLHEIAHVLLKHHDVDYSRSIKEVEAETIAYIVLSVCNNDEDLTELRGYIQHWLGENTLTDDISRRIINTASEILNTLKE